jgi:hypothetical protein
MIYSLKQVLKKANQMTTYSPPNIHAMKIALNPLTVGNVFALVGD